MYLIKWAGYSDAENTWEPRSHLPDSVFEDDSGTLACPFEVIATKTALSNAAALARHKMTNTPQPRGGDLSSDSSPEFGSGKDEWTPGSDETIVDVEEDSGGETEGYPGAAPAPKTRFAIEARSSPRTSPKKKAKKHVTLARVMMQRSDSVESYFRPAGHVRNVVEVPDCERGEFHDPNKPLLDGWLDAVDRVDRHDLSWTMVNPLGDLKKKPRIKGLNEAREFGVWSHVAFIKTELVEGKYARPFYRRPWVHGCLHCGRLIATGWSVMVGEPGNKRNHPTKGAWQSSKILDHLRICQSLPAEFATKLHNRDAGTKRIKQETGIQCAAGTSMPLKMGGGEVVFSSTLLPSTEAAARVAIARCIMYSNTRLPDTTVECPYEREKLRLVFKAGHEAALNGRPDTDYPFLHAKNVGDYISSECNVMYAYGQHYGNLLADRAKGNPHSQVQSDIVTLADRYPRQSIGHYSVCPRTDQEMVICTGFTQVLDKTLGVCAKDMEAQAMRFFKRKQLHVAHSIVTDVAAYGLGTTLEAGYNGEYTIRRDKCMMHQTGKLATFGMGTYVYKDGHGHDAFPCAQLKSFNDDFANLEKMYRTKQNSRDLSKAAELHGGCPKLRFRSNFNTTRAAGSMHQHTIALRLKKVIGYFELENPQRVTHNFVGDRWIELAEIQAIESVSGGLTMKCQVCDLKVVP